MAVWRLIIDNWIEQKNVDFMFNILGNILGGSLGGRGGGSFPCAPFLIDEILAACMCAAYFTLRDLGTNYCT